MGRRKQTVTTGYRYYFGLLMGLARGPVNGIDEIKVGDKRAWIGRQTNQSFNLIADLRADLTKRVGVWDNDKGNSGG